MNKKWSHLKWQPVIRWQCGGMFLLLSFLQFPRSIIQTCFALCLNIRASVSYSLIDCTRLLFLHLFCSYLRTQTFWWWKTSLHWDTLGCYYPFLYLSITAACVSVWAAVTFILRQSPTQRLNLATNPVSTAVARCRWVVCTLTCPSIIFILFS